MKKKILIIALIIVFAISLLFIFSTNNNNEFKNNNIYGQFSDIKINDIETAKKSIEAVKDTLNINSVEEELTVGKTNNKGELINTYKLGQKYKGIDVYNSGLIVYTDKERKCRRHYKHI